MSWLQQVALLVTVICSITHAQDGPTWPRPRRQFLGSEWVPINQPCPTCRQVAEPSDVRSSIDEIGLVPPRPPTTRQIHGSGNFFPQAPSLLQNSFAPQRQQFQEFLNFNPNVVQFPSQQQPFFTQQQQQSFLPQTYLNNPQLLLNENPQLLPLVNNPQILLAHQKQQQQQNAPQNTVPSDSKESQIRFRPETQKSPIKPPQNIRLEQQKSEGPLTRLELPLNSPPTQFNSLATSFMQQQQQPLSQFSQLTPEMQSLLQINPSDPFLTPPPFRNNTSGEIVIPGLDKEEIQLLYVPVETLRQRGHLQGHTIDDSKPTFLNQPFQQFQQFSQPPQAPQPPPGHFITQQPNPSPLPQFSPSPAPQFSPSPAPQFPSSPPPRFSPSPTSQFPSSPPPRFSPSPIPQFPSSSPTQFSQSPPPQLLASPSPLSLTQNLPSRDPPQQFAPPTLQPISTTEQVVTIQSRPISTVRQSENIRLTPRPSSRPTERPLTTLPNRSSPFTASTKVTENFNNDITPSFPRNSLSPALPTESPFQQLQNKPVQHRFTPRPSVETVTETIPTTTLQPHQPPLSIYMGSLRGDVQVIDVLRALKNANSIPVLDNFTPNDPRVFVGPANLNPPQGYGKFELPYLSSLDLNRIERKINLPFFVAPLNFNPPEGYSKIPFPAPHVGSVVVSTETEMRPAALLERGTTSEPLLSEQVNGVEQEATTIQPETTSTVRTRGRRPNQYRSSKKPITSSRQRVTPRPQEEETTFPVQENQASTQDFLREPQDDRKRGSPLRRQRLRTTTESTTEAITTESSFIKHNFEPQGPPVELNAQLVDFDHPQQPSPILQEPVLPPADFHQQQQVSSIQSQNNFAQSISPPSSDFRQPPSQDFGRPQFIPDYQPQPIPSFQPNQFSNQQGVFQPSQQEQQGIFEVPPPPRPHLPFIENNGDSGFQQPSDQGQQQIVSTEQPISSTQYSDAPIDHTTNPVEAEYETEVTSRPSSTSATQSTTQNEPDAENIDKELDSQVDIPKKTSRFSYPNVPGVKSHPSTTKVRSHLRSRPRGSQGIPQSTTTPSLINDDDEPAHVEVSATADDATTTSPDSTRTTSKYLSHFNRSRKPLRPTTSRSETTTSPTTRTYTVRPLRRSTLRTSVATKRIRKPTTPSPHDEEENDGADTAYAKKTQGNFTPSAASNEINDEQPLPAPKPKARKSYYQKKKTTESIDNIDVTSPSPSTKTYQERKDEGEVEDPKDEESRTHEFSSPSANDATLPSALSGPSGSDVEESKKTDERKKFNESDKKGRRRLRVRVQKRPHDNFEAAESQNHGSVANSLISSSPVKPTAPDLYKFTKGEFDFESSGKFIGTQQKGYVRNITADILENTSTFSSPGADTEVSRVTIATEPTTIVPEMSIVEEAVSENSTDIGPDEAIKQESTVKINETQEVTTQSHESTKYVNDFETTEESEITTVNSEDLTTVTVEAQTSTSSPEVQEPKQRKVLRTSTTTQVSRETEICYKGKCIKTNSDNPDQALKQLVESANLEEANKSKT